MGIIQGAALIVGTLFFAAAFPQVADGIRSAVVQGYNKVRNQFTGDKSSNTDK